MEDWERFQGFRRFVPPSRFAQEFLFFSDALGLMDGSELHIRREKFNNYIVMLVADGTLHVEQHGQHLALGGGQGVLLHLEPFHEYYSDEADPCTILWMHINGKGCPPLMAELQKLSPFPAVIDAEAVYPLFADCFDALLRHAEHPELVISAAIYQTILTIMGRQMHGPDNLAVVPRELFLGRVDAFINEHICEPISLDTLAGAVNMSKYYFCRRFKEESGLTPMQYVVRKKVDASKYFLQYTAESIQLIAERFSFTDQSHYAKLFKRHTGMSPKAYRNKGQN